MKNYFLKIVFWTSVLFTTMLIGCGKEYEDPRYIPGKLSLVYAPLHSDLNDKLDQNYVFIDTIDNVFTDEDEYRINLNNGWFVSNQIDYSMVLSNRFIKEMVDSMIVHGAKPSIGSIKPTTKPDKFYWLKPGINGIQQIKDSIDAGKIASIVQ